MLVSIFFLISAHASWLGLGFVTSITFIFLVGVFMSSWLGTSVLSLGEWFIKRMPFVRHIYSASKQISAAISPGMTSVCEFPRLLLQLQWMDGGWIINVLSLPLLQIKTRRPSRRLLS